MKHLTNFFTTIITLLLISPTLIAQEEIKTEQPPNAGNMKVRISQVESDEGAVMLGLYVGEENYENSEQFAAAKVQISEGVAEYTFENIPFGEYAIKCYHDENGNGKLDSNFMGIPSESYGFSNNASGTFGPADYEDAKFMFETDKQLHEINLQ